MRHRTPRLAWFALGCAALSAGAPALSRAEPPATPAPAPAPAEPAKPDAAKPEPKTEPAKKAEGPQDHTATLKVGDRLPALTYKDAEGKDVEVSTLYAQQPIVLIIYRGAWCPYCITSLKKWQEKVDTVTELGAKVIAVTPEKPALIAESLKKGDLTYTILSDASGKGAKALGLKFAVDEKTQERYKGFGVDLAARNGSQAWDLPHPATFIVDTAGVVRYISVNEDYKKRPNPEDVIAAMREVVEKKAK